MESPAAAKKSIFQNFQAAEKMDNINSLSDLTKWIEKNLNSNGNSFPALESAIPLVSAQFLKLTTMSEIIKPLLFPRFSLSRFQESPSSQTRFIKYVIWRQDWT
jgi:hypothetical protein